MALGIRIAGLGFRVEGLGFRVYGVFGDFGEGSAAFRLHLGGLSIAFEVWKFPLTYTLKP